MIRHIFTLLCIALVCATPANCFAQSPEAASTQTVHDLSAGFYIVSGTQTTQLSPTPYKARATASAYFAATIGAGASPSNFNAYVTGTHANIRTSEPSPVFYFYAEPGPNSTGFQSPAEFKLVRFEVKNNGREVLVMQMQMRHVFYDEKVTVPFISEKVKDGVFKLTPSSPLPPGEYAFITASALGEQRTKCRSKHGPPECAEQQKNRVFDFGVDSKE